jgi:hypothetical protein
MLRTRPSFSSGIPGYGLGPAGMSRLAELADDVVDLIDDSALDLVGKKALVISVGPFPFFRRNPVVVDSVHNLLAIDFEVLQAAGEGAMDTRLQERIFDHPHHRAVFARRVARLVVFGLDGDTLLPAGQDGFLPGLGQCFSVDKKGWYQPLHRDLISSGKRRPAQRVR